MNYKIAIIYTTFLRSQLMWRTVESIVKNIPENITLLIGDQSYTEEKINILSEFPNTRYCPLPLNCGLSYARNYLVNKAKELDYNYCLITADSILFTENTFKYLNEVTDFLEVRGNRGLVGFKINKRQDWEGDIYLIPDEHFEVKQLNKKINTIISYKNLVFYPCSVVRNFFLAKTQCLLENKWDDELCLSEHEDFFWRLKATKWNVFYTENITADYIDIKPENYSKFRQRMYHEFKDKLKAKYNLKNWVKYVR